MPETQRNSDLERQVPSLHGRAMENLEFIRDAMQRSGQFTAVPGYGGALMGLTAIGAGVVAAVQTVPRWWLLTWLVEALLASSIGAFAIWQKARNAETSLTSLPARKFALGFLPPVAAAVIISGLLAANGQFGLLPPVWLTLYGAAVVTGGAFSVKPVPAMGWVFLALGLASVFFPPGYGDYFMIAGFGVVQVVFGIVIGRRFGG